jgi:single-stranded-DNA-specific exonuclease
MTSTAVREIPVRAVAALSAAGIHPLLARLYAARGVTDPAELDLSFKALLPPDALTGARAAAVLLADAIGAGTRMAIVADYDCDGATACAVGMRALRAFGADVCYLVPDRAKFGYGLTPPVAELAARLEPGVLITVDNGIASIEGIAHARAHGMATVVTDHHLPGKTLPEADVIVNPNQPGCAFPSKALAGVGVIFYVMLALRAELRTRGAFSAGGEPNLATLLDLVALGTDADMVPLDHNNRILVGQGLQRMRAGEMRAGIRALFAITGHDAARASTFDLGFAIGPRLNAAGRLADMGLGIECLITDDPIRALKLAQELDHLNHERRAIETEMQDTALLHLDECESSAGDDPETRASLVLFEPSWHQGVVGLVASRIKDKYHRPTIAFARGQDGELKGSGRSIPGLHLRDALDLVTRGHPDLIVRFGGHAMAAGLSLREENFIRFRAAFEETVARLLDPSARERRIDTDGTLETGYINLQTARLLDREVWGQNFPPPVFEDVFRVERQRLLKERHLKLELSRGGVRFEAIRFNHAASAPDILRAAYRLGINEYQGVASVQLMLEHFEAA